MRSLNTTLPAGLVKEEPPFVPRMVVTPEIQSVTNEVILHWKHRDKFDGLVKFGIRPLDRLLFFGPPGNGKTMACYWIARELNLPVYRVLCNNLHGSVMGETSRAVSSIVDFFKSRSDPAICIFDEVESIFLNRGSMGGGACDREVAAALTVFLQALDRWTSPTLIVMCTNIVASLDPALLSRIELSLEFGGPNQEQATEMVNYWSELLCDSGGDVWGPHLTEQITNGEVPESFRDLHQEIAHVARDWVVSNGE